MSHQRNVILVDAKNLLYRHNAVNIHLSRGDGFPTGALYGCLNTMIALSKYIPKTPFVWVWDGDGETWRHKFMRDNSYFYSQKQQASTREPAIHKKVYGYKANRIPKEEKHDKSKWPKDLKARGIIQIPVLRSVLDGSGFRNYQIRNLEGDDLIAIITRYIIKHTDMDVIIHSGDKDFYQLMGERVKILSRIHDGKPVFVDPEDVEKKYGVSVKDWAKYRAWTGDSSDNIPHLPSVGPKAACNFILNGLDPSLELKEISDKIAKKFVRYFEPDGIVQCWPFAQSNYKLCKLVSDRRDSRFSHEVRDDLKELFKHLHFRRDSKRVTSDYYRRVSHLLMHYELKSILSKRDQLWRIP